MNINLIKPKQGSEISVIHSRVLVVGVFGGCVLTIALTMGQFSEQTKVLSRFVFLKL